MRQQLCLTTVEGRLRRCALLLALLLAIVWQPALGGADQTAARERALNSAWKVAGQVPNITDRVIALGRVTAEAESFSARQAETILDDLKKTLAQSPAPDWAEVSGLDTHVVRALGRLDPAWLLALARQSVKYEATTSLLTWAAAGYAPTDWDKAKEILSELDKLGRSHIPPDSTVFAEATYAVGLTLAARDLNRVVAIAEAEPDALTRALLLVAATSRAEAAEPSRTGDIFRMAYQAARQMGDAYLKAGVAFSLAGWLARQGRQEESVQVLNEAFDVVLSISDANLRREALSYASTSAQDAPAFYASAVADRLDDPPAKAAALAQAVRESKKSPQADKWADTLAALADQLTDPLEKIDACVAAAAYLAQSDSARAKALVQSAQSTAQGLRDPGQKATAFLQVVQAAAWVSTALATQIASAIEDQDTRRTALEGAAFQIIKADAQRGKDLFEAAMRSGYLPGGYACQAMVETDPEWAARVVSNLTASVEGVTGMVYVARACLSKNRPDLARELLDRAVAALRSSSEPHAKDALIDLAAVLSLVDIQAGLRLAESLPDASARDWAMGGIARSLAAQNPEQAEQIASNISDPQAKAFGLLPLVDALKEKDPSRAARLLRQAVEQVKEVSDPGIRADLLAEAAALAVVVSRDEALGLFGQAADAVRESAKDSELYRSRLVALVAGAAALDTDAAVALLRNLPAGVTSDSIIQEAVISRDWPDWEKAVALAERIGDPMTRFYTLLDISSAIAAATTGG